MVKVLTSTVETYKCQGLNLNFSTKCGTLQVDLCDNVNIVFEKAEHFFETAGSATKDKNTSMIVWAGCDDLNVKVAETSATFKTVSHCPRPGCIFLIPTIVLRRHEEGIPGFGRRTVAISYPIQL